MSAATRSRIGKGRIELITISVSTGYIGPVVAKEYIPTVTTTDSEGRSSTRDLYTHEYPVENVMLVHWVGKVAERVAVGNIVRPAWKKLFEGYKWIVLG
jgi:hypothetical protein